VATLLSERGYTTKIVVVMMDQETHVVCHVSEVKGYLDFNHRANSSPLVKSGDALEEIARKVAAEFRSNWRMVSEVRYANSRPIFEDCVFYNEPVNHRGLSSGDELNLQEESAATEQAPVIASKKSD
jgi:hypothetical protein